MRPNPLALLPLAVAAGLALSACGSNKADAPPSDAPAEVKAGFALAQSYGCMACHSTDGAARSGPTFKGLFESEAVLSSGERVKVDDSYLQLAISQPDAQVRKGYAKGIMAKALENQDPLDQRQVADLVAYVKSLK